MKKIFLLTIIGLACLGAISWAWGTGKQFRSAQSGIASLPSYNLLLMDSSSLFNTKQLAVGHPTILMYFSPDCDHCQEQTKNLIKNIEALKDVQICLFTPMPLNEMKSFYQSFHLGNYKNIIVAQDHKFSFYNFFKVSAFPCTAIYDGQKKLVKLYREEVNMNRVFRAIHT